MSERQWNVLSLGAGVQSSTLALMAAHGEVTPMPDFAVFADTQDEPASVYRWLDWLEKQLPFSVHRVTKGKLSEATLQMRVTKDGRQYSRTNIPFFTKNQDGSFGMIPHRSCTSDYKIQPILKFNRKMCGVKRGQKHATVTSYIGISYDEMQRMKVSREKWCVNRWPLVEKKITRRHCIEWMRSNGYPEPPRSSCVFCPFHDNNEWRKLKNDMPEEFQKAVEFEKAVQIQKQKSSNFSSMPFLHASRKPLDEVDFRNDLDHGQLLFPGFIDECEGMCGV